jgi:hypothetical protein
LVFASQGHELSPLPQGEKRRRRSIIRSTRMLRIRQKSGLNLSAGLTIWPLRTARILTLTDFHEISRAEGPGSTEEPIEAIQFGAGPLPLEDSELLARATASWPKITTGAEKRPKRQVR